MQRQQYRLAIVDDHKLFRKGLIKLIHAINERLYHILIEAENGEDLISKLDRTTLPDIIIMDIDMPKMSGFETVAWLQDHHPDIPVLIVSMIEKEEAIVRMLKLGVKGYLSKDIEPEDLSAALKAILSKGFYYTDFITGKLIHSLQHPETIIDGEGNQLFNHDIWNRLNENERQFIKYACTELTYEEIAQKMHVSPKTIDGYRGAVFQKVNTKNRVGLVIFAIKNGLVTI